MPSGESTGERGKIDLWRVPPGKIVPREHDPAEVTDEALSYLRMIVAARPGGRHASHGIAAASRLLEWSRWREEFDAAKEDPARVLAALLGDEDKLLAWMRETLPRLEAKQREASVGTEAQRSDPVAPRR